MDQILYFQIRDVQISLQYDPGSSKWAISLDLKMILFLWYLTNESSDKEGLKLDHFD